MTGDERALLAAVVADPADDTVRLAYADCIEERGDAARAEFIRAQVAAERLHPDSNARAALEERAGALFAEHWVDWWGEVCAAVGLRPPAARPAWRPVPPPRRSGAGWVDSTGLYDARTYRGTTDFHVGQNGFLPGEDHQGFATAIFRRGFPDALQFGYHPTTIGSDGLLRRWPVVAPLARLIAGRPPGEGWHDGPHLAGLRALSTAGGRPAALHALLASPHLLRLDELSLWPARSDEGAPLTGEFEAVVASPAARRLKRLSIPVLGDEVADALAAAAALAGLEQLDVALPTGDERAAEVAAGLLRILARSPHLAGLRGLTVEGGLNTDGMEALVCGPAWTGLRKLGLSACDFDLESPVNGGRAVFLAAATLNDLDELYLDGVLSHEPLIALAASALPRQLRHFRGKSRFGPEPFLDLAGALDADRVETVAFGGIDFPESDLRFLRGRFGDRLRLYAE